MYNITIDEQDIAVKNFLGFGVEWDPLFWHDFNLKAGVNEDDWQLIQKRINWMKLPIVRMQMLANWVYKGDNKYNWDNKEMNSLYKHLDVCQKANIPVILADWGIETWAPLSGVKSTADPKYAEVIGTYLDNLINRRKYSCIKYFIFVNGPNHELKGWKWWKRWDRWKKGFENLQNELIKRDLAQAVKIIGPDLGVAYNIWHKRAVKQLHKKIDCYSLHYYADDHVNLLELLFLWKKSVIKGQLEELLRKRWDFVVKNDPSGNQKPLLAGEIGMWDSAIPPIGNKLIDTFWYGLAITDFAIQVVRAGTWAACAWMLDDTCHEGFFWGLWAGKAKNFKLRPWFYPWALLSKLFPPNSTIFRVESLSKSIRFLAGRFKDQWTFCIVNRSDSEISFHIKVIDGGSAIFKQYLYTQDKAPADQDGFPIPISNLNTDLNKGMHILCPSRGLTFLSSLY